MEPSEAIETQRLQLKLLPTACLQALHTGDHHQAQLAAGFQIAPDCVLLGNIWVGHRLRLIEGDADQHPWMYRAIVRRHDQVMVGHISFHHKAPDPFYATYSLAAAELGYTIEAPYRQQGYARESVLAMMEWARQRGVTDFFLTISPDNLPSIRLAESMHYRKIGELTDEIDGIEYLYTAT